MTAKNRIQRLKNGIFVKNMGVKGLCTGWAHVLLTLPTVTTFVVLNTLFFLPPGSLATTAFSIFERLEVRVPGRTGCLFVFRFIHLLLLIYFVSPESGLRCFECRSTVSLEECKKHHKEVVCKSSMDDRCYYASIQATSHDGSSVAKLFAHGCTSNYYCNNTKKLFEECGTLSGKCGVQCCTGNLYNEGNNM